MGETAANVLDKFGSLSIEVGIFISIFIGNGARRIIEFTNVGSGDGGVLFNEFG